MKFGHKILKVACIVQDLTCQNQWMMIWLQPITVDASS